MIEESERPCGSVVEHALGKGEIESSILSMGSKFECLVLALWRGRQSLTQVTFERRSVCLNSKILRIIPAAAVVDFLELFLTVVFEEDRSNG